MLRYFLRVVIFYMFMSLSVSCVDFTPTTFHFPIENRQTQELSVINQGNTPVRYRVVMKRPGNQKDSDLYMGDWIRYYPKILSVPPKSARVVRFRVAPPKTQKLETGEYRAILSLEEIASKNEDYNNPDQKVDIQTEEKGTSLSMDTLFVFDFSLYGSYGEVSPKLEFKNFNIVQDEKNKDKLWLKGEIVNKGNVSKKTVAYITFEDKNGKKSKEKLELILPISIRENTALVNVYFKKPMENIKKADLEIKYWTPLEVGDSIIEQKSIGL